MRNLLFTLVLLLLPSLALAGGFEVLENSPAGVGTAGAQSAVVDDSGAVFYNPAKMTFIKGFSGMVSANIIDAPTKATAPPGQGIDSESHLTTGIPYIYAVQRIGSRFAVGIGGFTNMSEQFTWPQGMSFGGRFLGWWIKLAGINIQPTAAFRPLPWLALGVGIVISPTSIEIQQTLQFGGAEGNVHTSASTTGVGGVVGLYIRAVPRWLDLAFTYRSAIDLDFTGKAALNIPPELSALASPVQNMSTSLTLPHNFTFGVGSHLAPHFSVDFDVHVTLWEVLKSLTLTLTDPNAPPGTPATTQSQALNFNTSYDLRLGLEYRLLNNEALRLRIGGGYVRTPVPRASVRPLSPDADRGLFGFGIGYHYKWFGADASYLLQYVVPRTSAEPTYPATYQTTANIVAIGVSLKLEKIGPHIDPAFE
jgi:long-chain fatty acid transport protein